MGTSNQAIITLLLTQFSTGDTVPLGVAQDLTEASIETTNLDLGIDEAGKFIDMIRVKVKDKADTDLKMFVGWAYDIDADPIYMTTPMDLSVDTDEHYPMALDEIPSAPYFAFKFSSSTSTGRWFLSAFTVFGEVDYEDM
jgi:hypothetical protein